VTLPAGCSPLVAPALKSVANSLLAAPESAKIGTMNSPDLPGRAPRAGTLPVRRRLARAFILAVAGAILLVAARAQEPAAKAVGPPVPAGLDGQWLGTVQHGTEAAEVGFEFTRQPDGRVLAREWMPEINAYGATVGWVHFDGAHFSIPESNINFVLENGTLAGTSLWLPSLTFTARATQQLPVEAPVPEVPAGPEPAWTYRGGAAFWGSPVVAGDTVYLGDAAGKFHAVGTADGRPRWVHDAGSAVFGTAAVTSDGVLFTTDRGELVKLDPATGTERWRATIGGADVKRSLPSPEGPEWDSLAAAPVVDGGTVFVGSADGAFRALDAANGKVRWLFQTGGKIRAAALASGARVFVGSMDHFVYALDRATGAEAWRFDTGSPVTTAPVAAGHRIVIGTRDQSLLYSLDAASGKTAWTDFYWLSWVESAPALVDGLLYIGSSDCRRVRVIEPETGRVRWAAQVWGWTWGTPLVVGDTVYFGTAGAAHYFITQRPSLGALDRATGKLKWRRPLALSPAAYVGGVSGSLARAGNRVIAAQLDGTLVAYPIK